jgi:CxxC motif-containing protein
MPKSKRYVVADGHIVNRKPAGHVFTEDELEHVNVLVAAGIVVPESPKPSGTMKTANPIASKEDDN